MTDSPSPSNNKGYPQWDVHKANALGYAYRALLAVCHANAVADWKLIPEELDDQVKDAMDAFVGWCAPDVSLEPFMPENFRES